MLNKVTPWFRSERWTDTDCANLTHGEGRFVANTNDIDIKCREWPDSGRSMLILKKTNYGHPVQLNGSYISREYCQTEGFRQRWDT